MALFSEESEGLAEAARNAPRLRLEEGDVSSIAEEEKSSAQYKLCVRN